MYYIIYNRVSFLTAKDHQDICEVLKDLDLSHLVQLGGALGLSHNTCKKFSDVGDLVASWLRREDHVLSKSGKPTWSKLADALEKIGQTGIAQDVKHRYANEVQQVGHDADQPSSNYGLSAGGHSVRNDTGRL